jgi:SM-20-related protein
MWHDTRDDESIARTLASRGWVVCDDFCSPDEASALRACLRAKLDRRELRPAAIGRGAAARLAADIRGDRIVWLQAPYAVAEAVVMQRLDALRVTLNRACWLGLEVFESHYAWYPPGAIYQRHRDRHSDSDARVLSAVLYVNEPWPDDAGGALRLFVREGESLDIAPLGGRLVLFLAADFEHEVLVADRDRYSIAGWFRRRELTTVPGP